MLWKPHVLWVKPPTCIVLLILCSLSTQANRVQKPQHRVRYDIISNNVVSNKAWGYEARTISLLMDPGDFTEPKLRWLMTYFFKKYPRPNSISVYLDSHPDQSDFVNRRLPDMKDPKRDEAFRKYPHGIIFRVNGKEIIRYTIPPALELKTIVVKGKD